MEIALIVNYHTIIITHAVQSHLSVCLFVRALKGKQLQLPTPNLVHVYSIAVAEHALTQRSKNKVTRLVPKTVTVASDTGRYSTTQYAAVLPAAVGGVGLHVDTTAYVI